MIERSYIYTHGGLVIRGEDTELLKVKLFL